MFAVANQKGGVAKTTTVQTLGAALAELGERVLLVDLDPQACLTFAVGLEPACVKSCPTGAIVFGTKEDMIHHAEGRIDELKGRGFANAGLYDPPGVGGTHVMYVLPHADRPEAYSGLPRDPTIAASVAAWKGPLKPVGMALLGLTALGAFIHYLKYGRKEIEHESTAGGERDQRGEA